MQADSPQALLFDLGGVVMNIDFSHALRSWAAHSRLDLDALQRAYKFDHDAKARRRLPCYAFTNTNASHMACWSRLYPGIVAAFDEIFASHQIGLRKPERAAFQRICTSTGLEPAAFLFFDDLPENVHAAEEAGLRAVLVRSTEDVALALRGLGIECEA